MSKSSDEAEIRNAVVSRLRQLLPSARIVHELNVAGTGSNRIDVAAINNDAIVAVEIKSRRDVLKRLDDQWAAFNACCHFTIVAAHECHFRHGERPASRLELFLDHPIFFDRWYMHRFVWRYPTPEVGFLGERPWTIEKDAGRQFRTLRKQPKAASMLEMLWAEELRAESDRHHLPNHRRLTRLDMITNMVWHMTGREICEAVCRQLRSRTFKNADAPIPVFETEAAA